jgi:hypothetical protein
MITTLEIPQRSGRCSARVPFRPPHYTAIPGLEPISAPESLRPTRGPSPSPERRAAPAEHRVSRTELDRLDRRLSERDRAVLTSLRMHHFLTTTQLQRFHFADHHTPAAAARICRRVLARLYQLRVIEHLDRRIGGIRAGSASYVWRIGLIGDRLLRQHDDHRARSRRKEPSPRHLLHRLAIADVHLALREIGPDGPRLETVATEPGCWRTFTSPTGSPTVLKPDLYAVTSSGDYEDHWFIEVDRATESLPTLLAKCAQYQHYRLTNLEQQRHGIFPRVLWVLPTERYADTLRRAIDQAVRLPAELFRVCTLPTLTAALQEPTA